MKTTPFGVADFFDIPFPIIGNLDWTARSADALVGFAKAIAAGFSSLGLAFYDCD